MKKITSTLFIASSLLIASASYAGGKNSADVEFLNSKPSNAALPFSEIVRVDNTLYLSGQIGFDPKTGKLAEGGFKGEAQQTMANIKNTLEKHGYSMKDVVKCMVMLTDMKDFKAFNQIYTQYFSAPYPARSAFAAAQLALNSKVEVECMAVATKAKG